MKHDPKSRLLKSFAERYDLAMAAGWDAGNREMKRRGLPSWNRECALAAEKAFNLVMGRSNNETQSER